MFNFRINGIIAGAAFLLSFLVGLISGAAMPMLLVKPLIFAVVFFILPSLARLLAEHFLPELLEDAGTDAGSEFLPGSRVNIMEGDSAVSEGPSGLSSIPAFMMSGQGENGENLGDISELMRSGAASRVSVDEKAESAAAGTTGMDQDTKNGYTTLGDLGDFPNAGMSDIFDVDVFSDSVPGGTREALGTGAGPVNAGSPRAVPSAPSPGAVSAESGRADSGTVFDSGEILRDLDSMAGAFASDSSQEEPETTEYSVSLPLKKPPQSRNQTWAGDFNAKDIAQGLRTVLNKDKEG